MSEKIKELIAALEGDPRPEELEYLITQVIVEALRQRRKDIADQLGPIDLRTMRDGGTYGPFQDFKSDQELDVNKHLALGLARLLDVPPTDAKRLSGTVFSPTAARRMETYFGRTGLGQTKFAVKVGCSEKTLRNFRKTGKVRSDILAEIAQAMHTTPEELLRSE